MEWNESAGRGRQSSRRWFVLVGTATLSLGVTLVPLTWALEDAKPAATGLRGMLPAEAPASISFDAFAALDGNWQEWSEKAAADVGKLYTEDIADVAGQREQLAVLQKRLDTMEKSLRDPRYASLHVPLAGLHSALNRRVALATAILDTLAIDPQKAATERLDVARNELTNAVQNLEKDLKTVQNGPAWLSYVRSADLIKVVSEKKGQSETMPVLTAVRHKLSPTETMTPEIRQFLDGARFVALRESVDRYVKIAAELDRPVNADKLRTELTQLVSAVESFEASQSVTDALAVRKAFEAVRKESLDGGERIAQVMSTHYFNYNLRVVLSEKFLTKLVAERTTKQGPVSDWILGAKVDGNQVTNATIGVDLKPSPNSVRFHLTLQGVSQSNTQGVTSEATVYTTGYHTFNAWKPVLFDGDKLSTSPADIRVNTNNQTRGIATSMSGTLFGGIADSIASREVERKRPQAEAIAAQRLSSKLLPEFNQEVDGRIVDLNKKIDTDVNGILKKKDLFPSATSYRSSEDEMRANLRLMGDRELAGSDGPFVNMLGNGFVVAVHESLLNNSIDRLKFAGRTLTEDQLASEIEKSFEELLGRPFKAKAKIEEAAPGSKDPATFIFPDKDPLRFRSNNGSLTLVIRAGLKQKAGEEDIPTQEITVPLSFRVEGTQLVAESGSVSVSPVDPPKSTGLQIARAGVVRTKIQNALPTRKFERFISIEKNRQTPISVGLTNLQAAAGWLVLTFE